MFAVEDDLKADLARLTLDVAAGERRTVAIHDMTEHIGTLGTLVEELRTTNSCLTTTNSDERAGERSAVEGVLGAGSGIELELVTSLAERPWSEDILSRLKVRVRERPSPTPTHTPHAHPHTHHTRTCTHTYTRTRTAFPPPPTMLPTLIF